MFDLGKLRKEKGTSDWYCEGEDGVEIFVGGTEEGPIASALEDAALVVVEYELLKNKAIKLLESFMKDTGSWSLGTIFIGPFHSVKDGDVALELGFEADHNKHEYNYSGFTVHFALNKKWRHLGQTSHPYKFTVEFS